jgi:hypothetical protein
MHVEAVVGLAETAKPTAAASAVPGACTPEYCCHLAMACTVCWGACNYTCPSGWHRQVWYRQYASRIIGCGDCTNTTSGCETGTRFYCSVSWDDSSC